MSRATSLPLLAFAVLLSGCGHAWPPAAGGGLAERIAPAPTDLAETAHAADRALETGAIGPADAAIIRETIVVAQREAEAGLPADAEASALAASVKLGGADVATREVAGTCLKTPCE